MQDDKKQLLKQVDDLQKDLEKYYLMYKSVSAENESLRHSFNGISDNPERNSTAIDDSIWPTYAESLQSDLEKYYLMTKKMESDKFKDQFLRKKIKDLMSTVNGKQSAIDRKNKKLHSFSQKIKKLTKEKVILAEQLDCFLRLPERKKGWWNSLRSLILFKVFKFHCYEKITKGEMKIYRLIRNSQFFDVTWYLSQYPDVARNRLDPVLHYIRYGGFEGRKPVPYFDSAFYLSTYTDVKKENMNPLVHYILHGKDEERSTQP